MNHSDIYNACIRKIDEYCMKNGIVISFEKENSYARRNYFEKTMPSDEMIEDFCLIHAFKLS